MTDLKVEVDPGEVGFDATRLHRIEGHFRDYVDDGRLADGWLPSHATASSYMSPITADVTSRRACRSNTTRYGASTR